MIILIDILIDAAMAYYHWRKKRNARPLPKIVGSVPYCPPKK